MCCCCCWKEKERVPEAAGTLCYIVVSIKLGSDDAEQSVGGARSFVLLLLLQVIEGLEGVVQLQLDAVVL